MKLLVANWKMNFSPQEEKLWIQNYIKESFTPSCIVVLCPSNISLEYIYNYIKNKQNSSIKIGAQGCSEYTSGPHTNQIAARFLAQIGCEYVIVGHSEEKISRNLSYAVIARQAHQALQASLIPIICIGESLEEKQNNLTQEILGNQLKTVLKNLPSTATFYIAYEPLWAIGSGKNPTPEEIQEIAHFIMELTKKHTVLYGGSVTKETIKHYSEISELKGFLIGNASLDFQKFKKIVSLVT